MHRVLLSTDEPVLARGLQATLPSDTGLTVSVCETLTDLPSQARALAPCVLLIDWTRDITFALLGQLRREAPDCPIVLWSRVVPTELAYQAIEVGVRGVLRKTLGPDLVLKCLSRVAGGETWFDKTLTASFLAAKTVSLTRRESQLVTLLSQGLKNKEIATALSISEGTVKVYLSRLFQKLGVKDRFELALYGLRNMQGGETAGRKIQQPAGSQPAAAGPKAPALRSIVLDKPLDLSTLPLPQWDSRS